MANQSLHELTVFSLIVFAVSSSNMSCLFLPFFLSLFHALSPHLSLALLRYISIFLPLFYSSSLSVHLSICLLLPLSLSLSLSISVSLSLSLSLSSSPPPPSRIPLFLFLCLEPTLHALLWLTKISRWILFYYLLPVLVSPFPPPHHVCVCVCVCILTCPSF